ncbi:MAG TPA: tetratricopeptide repeat protein [Pyrinomonadaceae bacterium]
MRKRVLAIIGMLLLIVAPALGQDNSDLNKGDPETRKLLEQGSRSFLDGDYKRAIPPYQKALDREKENRTLGDTIWRVMVDNLGMAYGISGDLKKAKETFEYGLSKDPKYPMFNYNMARTFAEMNDVDKAISYLQQAFQNKQNMIKGERFPDPWTDDSFQRFMKDDKFVNALKEMSRN